jgi:hypothetical protein
MPFINELLNYKSISFVGMEKNAGKTEALNYVIKRLNDYNKTIAVTSIGIDGETLDQVTETSKPRVFLYPNSLFITSEKLYPKKEIVCVVEDISHYGTSLGRLIEARSKTFGNVMLSGPTDTLRLKQLIDKTTKKIDICLIDGALSRKSFASPSVTDAMILSTGAVVSASIDKIVQKTLFMYEMTKLPEYESVLTKDLLDIQQGVYAISKENEIIDMQIPSMLMLEKYKDKIFSVSKTLFIPGMITNKLLELIATQKDRDKFVLIIKDFTHVFSDELNTRTFLRNGGKILCLCKTNLLAITVNPVSPNGFKLDSEQLVGKLREKISLPIYNIRDVANDVILH